MTELLAASQPSIRRLRAALRVAESELEDNKLLASARHAQACGATPEKFVAELAGYLSASFEVDHEDLEDSEPPPAMALEPPSAQVRAFVEGGADFETLAAELPRYKNAMRELKALFLAAGRAGDIPAARLVRESALAEALKDYRPCHWAEVAAANRVAVEDPRDLELAAALVPH